jgi:hypothetical protein
MEEAYNRMVQHPGVSAPWLGPLDPTRRLVRSSACSHPACVRTPGRSAVATA